MDRAAVIRTLRSAVHAELAQVLEAAAAAYDEATSEESRPENEYDTRSLEASYLAAGQSVRVAALRRLTSWYDALDADGGRQGGPIGLGALVLLEDEEGRERWSFLAPDGGGRGVDVGGTTVRVVTPRSPLGAALIGAREGDAIEVEEPRRQELAIVAVRGV